MSPYYRPKVKAAQYSVSNGKNSKYSDDHSHQEDATVPPPPTPLNKPVKTKLTTRASLFVPGQMPLDSEAAAFIPQGNTPKTVSPWTPPDGRPCGGGNGCPGKDCLQKVLETTLGTELWDLSMVDYQSLDGNEWYTHVDVVIPALSASMCHLAASQDVEAIFAAQQAAQSMAMQKVCDALSKLGSKVTVVPSEDGSPQVSMQYCEADKDTLCWEFAHRGHCPRMSTCRWHHAFLETFLINFMLQPLTSWGFGSPTTGTPNTAEGQAQMAPPMANEQNHSSTLSCLPLTNGAFKTTDQKNCYLVDPEETPWPDHIKEPGFNMKVANGDQPQITKTNSKELTPTLRAKNPSRRMWADIQEDSDDELPRSWST